MSARNGSDYLRGLRERPREVWLRGERVEDVATHPALRGTVEQIAGVYDLQWEAGSAETMLYTSPSSGDPVATAFMIPRCGDDLVKRGHAFRLAAEQTLGLMGRSPDFLNTTLMAFAEARDVFDRPGTRFAANVVEYYEYVRENDLFLTHALITPQIDRSRPSGEQRAQTLHMSVVDENSEGLVVHGARMLATLAAGADELLVYNLPGLREGDEQHAVVFALPVNTPGLRFLCREPYEDGHALPFNRPLTSHFDENDALVVFDEVLVRWERVFLYGDVALANRLYPDTNVRQHTAHQSNIRGLVKMQLAVGLAAALAQAVRADTFLHVQEMLGECVGYLELIRGAITRAEVEHETTAWGTVRAKLEPLQALRGFLPHAYPRVIEVLQTIGAGGLIMMPSAEDFASPVKQDIEHYFQGAEGLPAVERVRLFKVAWDLAASAFGMRQLQYERYYAGDPVRLLASTYLGYDLSEARALVDRALELAGSPDRTPATSGVVPQ
jgi:anthranilate 3-monooxygenase (FAD) / 4-hydroxyphenylacetate 3-monooxygenase